MLYKLLILWIKKDLNMRKIAFFITLSLLVFNIMFGFSKEFSSKDFSFTLSAPKNFTSGSNEFSFKIQKNGASVDTQKVQDLQVVFFMPEMPGMPKMSANSNLAKDSSDYKGVVNLAHGGTWQIRVSFSYEGKKYNAKTSIDF